MIEMADKVSIKGSLTVKVYKKGVLVEETTEHNLVVNSGRDQITRLLAGQGTIRSINRIAFGTNGTAPEAEDSVITGQYARPVDGYSFPQMGQVQIDWNLPVAENNGMAILEFGLLTVDGTLFARRTRQNPIYKESDISIEGRWTIIF